MALVVRSKPSAHNRKRQAQHHRRGKRYIKAYLPYLPMLAIVGLGVMVNNLWAGGAAGELSAASSAGSQTRLSNLTDGSSVTDFYVVLAITFVAFAIFVITHWYQFHRLLNRGEAFVVRHPWIDISLVFVVTAGVVLTRSQ